MRRNGFSLIEFLISITIMFLIAASVIPILFKKNKKTEPVRRENKVAVFSCVDKSGKTEFTFTPKDKDGKVVYDPERNEFFTVTLIGGGGGGSGGGKAGAAGEVKQIILPSMPGEYRITLGKGGGSGASGGVTKLERIVKGSPVLIEYARGGVSSNESAASTEESKAQLPGIRNNLADKKSSGCGKGGSGGGSGVTGEVIIEWR